MKRTDFVGYLILLTAVFAACVIPALAEDLTIKKTITVSGASFSQETYVKGARERNVMALPGAGSMASIRQCDLKQTLTVNEAMRTYFVSNDATGSSPARAATPSKAVAAPPRQGGIVNYRVTSTNTGEKKSMFGFNARRVKTLVETEPSPGACTTTKSNFEIDGWYIDLPEQAACERVSSLANQDNSPSECQDRINIKQSGNGIMGFPLAETIQMHVGNNAPVQMATAVVAITRGTLAAELFDVPAGYRKTSSMAELSGAAMGIGAAQAFPGATPSPVYAMPQAAAAGMPGMAGAAQQGMMAQMTGMAMGGQQAGMAQQTMMAQMTGMTMSGQQEGQSFEMPPTPETGGAAVPAPAALGPKAPGKIRIGVAPVRAQLGQGMNAQMDHATPIRNTIIQMMSGPAVEVIPLDARIPVQLDAEALQKQCDFILSSGVTVKRGGGFGLGKLAQMASPVANMGAIAGAAGSMGGAIATQVASSALSGLAGFTGEIKNKDDVTFDYQLLQQGQQVPRLSKSIKAKAKSDGEDVLTPLIEQTAGSVVTEAITKK